MFMNRWLFRHEIVELNELNSKEDKEVFAVVKPFLGEGGEARFLESEADDVIAQIRKGRPPIVDGVSLESEGHMNTTATGEDRFDRFFDRLVTVLERFVPPDGAGQRESQQRMLTSYEAAEAMHLNSQTVVKWCRAGKLTGSKVGRNWLVPREAVDAYVHRQRLVYGRGVK